MQETDLDLLTRVAEAAGKIAMGFFKSDPEVWDKGGAEGPVTEADLAVNEMLIRELRAARPDYGWLSEESEDSTDRLSTKRQFVVDPIDGTRSFIDGSNDWAHALAVVEEGQPIAGVVAMPARQTVYAAARGAGATMNGTAISVRPERPLNEAEVLTARPNLRPEYWASGQRPPFAPVFRSSLAYRLCLIAQGRFDAMMTLRPSWEWDIAAGALIAQEAGAMVHDQKGLLLRFNNEVPKVNGVIAGVPSTVNAIFDALD